MLRNKIAIFKSTTATWIPHVLGTIEKLAVNQSSTISGSNCTPDDDAEEAQSIIAQIFDPKIRDAKLQYIRKCVEQEQEEEEARALLIAHEPRCRLCEKMINVLFGIKESPNLDTAVSEPSLHANLPPGTIKGFKEQLRQNRRVRNAMIAQDQLGVQGFGTSLRMVGLVGDKDTKPENNDGGKLKFTASASEPNIEVNLRRTAKEAKEKLAQAIEHNIEKPLAEAAKRNKDLKDAIKIVPEKPLAQVEMKGIFSVKVGEKDFKVHKCDENNKLPNTTDLELSLDKLANTCASTPVNQIDRKLLEELSKMPQAIEKLQPHAPQAQPTSTRVEQRKPSEIEVQSKKCDDRLLNNERQTLDKLQPRDSQSQHNMPTGTPVELELKPSEIEYEARKHENRLWNNTQREIIHTSIVDHPDNKSLTVLEKARRRANNLYHSGLFHPQNTPTTPEVKKPDKHRGDKEKTITSSIGQTTHTFVHDTRGTSPDGTRKDLNTLKDSKKAEDVLAKAAKLENDEASSLNVLLKRVRARNRKAIYHILMAKNYKGTPRTDQPLLHDKSKRKPHKTDRSDEPKPNT